jgi:hypothetical protein
MKVVLWILILTIITTAKTENDNESIESDNKIVYGEINFANVEDINTNKINDNDDEEQVINDDINIDKVIDDNINNVINDVVDTVVGNYDINDDNNNVVANDDNFNNNYIAINVNTLEMEEFRDTLCQHFDIEQADKLVWPSRLGHRNFLYNNLLNNFDMVNNNNNDNRFSMTNNNNTNNRDNDSD